MLTSKNNVVKDPDAYVQRLSADAKKAAQQMASACTNVKNQFLHSLAEKLNLHTSEILLANQKDIQLAQKNNVAAPLIDRLLLNEKRIDGIITSVRRVAELPDPIGRIDDMKYTPANIRVGKMRVPLGLVGIIYESRPNVTIDAAILCLKAGNACILRGGSEALFSNILLGEILRDSLSDAKLPVTAANIISTTDRSVTEALISTENCLDVLIPRGGKGLIEYVSRNARVNVIKHLDGNCHVYVSEHANLEMAFKIAVNAKTRRYGVCNAMESMLVHQKVAEKFLPMFAQEMSKHRVELRGCAKTCAIVKDAQEAVEEDWMTEYLAPVLSIKLVKDVDEAILHINTYGSQHTDAIVTECYSEGDTFLRAIDSSSVIWNASTGFADGFEYGLGAEVGISTDKFHARGPVGLEGLTCQKYIVLGRGEIRDS